MISGHAERPRELEELHEFATDRQLFENQVFWTRLAKFLLMNSILVPGFALLEQ